MFWKYINNNMFSASSMWYMAVLVLFLSCKNPTASNAVAGNNSTSQFNRIQQLQWLLGTWKSVVKKGTLYEIWKKSNDTLYTGRSFIVTEKRDTVFLEVISLLQKKDSLLYIPAVYGQNSGLPVSFALITATDGSFVFENKQHDFPQRIIYENPVADSLFARIEGNKGKVFAKEEYRMQRVEK